MAQPLSPTRGRLVGFRDVLKQPIQGGETPIWQAFATAQIHAEFPGFQSDSLVYRFRAG